SRLQPVRRSGQSAQRPRGRWELTRGTGHTCGQPRSAANSPRTAITTPRAIFAAAAVARPTTAPHPARTAVAGARDSEYSNSAAPANDPTNAPITLPTIGTGTPITAPTIPPTRAPQADRREPPNVLANRNPSHASMISPRNARPRLRRWWRRRPSGNPSASRSRRRRPPSPTARAGRGGRARARGCWRRRAAGQEGRDSCVPETYTIDVTILRLSLALVAALVAGAVN